MTKHNLMELIGNDSGTLPLTVPLWNYTELIVHNHTNSVYLVYVIHKIMVQLGNYLITVYGKMLPSLQWSWSS